MEARLSTLVSAWSRIQWAIARASEAAESDLWANYGWLLTTSLAMIVAYVLNIPNAGVFLLIAVLHSTFVGGWKAGLASATLSTVYSGIFLSLPDQLFHYTDSDVHRLVENAVAFFGCVWLVFHLHRKEAATIQHADEQTIREQAVARSDRLVREIIDSAPVMLWIADANGKRIQCNRRLLEFSGTTEAEQLGDAWQSRIHPADATSVLARYSFAIRSCERFEIEYRLRAANGEYHWVQDFGAPRISSDGRPAGFIGSTVDRNERKRVESALHQLSGRLLELQDDERRRIARELHDTTAQNLAALSMNLHLIRENDLDFRARQAIVESIALTERSTHEIRTLSYLLHPPLLDELGLMSALRSYTAGFTQRSGILVELKTDEIGRLPRDIEITLFRIVQEALTNVHRHSGSQRAEIRVVRDPREVRLHVADFGRGVPDDVLNMIGESGSLGVGIAGMRERAGQLGGQLKMASSSSGTTITVVLPLRDDK